MESRGARGRATVVIRPLAGSSLQSLRRGDVAKPIRAAALIASACLAIGLAASAQAQEKEYPSETIKMIVPWPAGGGADTLARKLADKLSQRLKHPVIIQNMGGATGTIGTQAAATAAADGYTLLFVSSEHAINQGYFKKLNYDGIRDFVPIAGIATQPFVILAGAGEQDRHVQRTGRAIEGHAGKTDIRFLG